MCICALSRVPNGRPTTNLLRTQSVSAPVSVQLHTPGNHNREEELTAEAMTENNPIVHTEWSQKKRPIELTIKCRFEEFEPLMKSYKPGEGLWSSGVSSKLAPHAVWKLNLYPNGYTEKQKGSISVFLRLTGSMKDNKETLDAAFHIYLLDGSGRKIDVASRRTENFEGGRGRGQHVGHERVKKALQADGSLVVGVDFEFLSHRDHGDVTAISESNLHIQWHDSIGKLRETEANSDCTLMVGGEQLNAYRFPLTAISPIFERMFGNPASQYARDGIVRIEDWPGMLRDTSAKPYRALLSFAYSGRVDWTLYGDCKRDVLVVACKYLVLDLKHHVESLLIDEINPESFAELALLADTYSCNELKKACVRYLSSNVEAVVLAPQWEALATTRRLTNLSFELLRLVRESRAAATEGGTK